MFLLLFSSISFSKELTCDSTRKILSNALENHYDKNELTPDMIEQAITHYVERMDSSFTLITEEEFSEIKKDAKKNKQRYLDFFLTEKELKNRIRLGVSEIKDAQCLFLLRAFVAIKKGQDRYEQIFAEVKNAEALPIEKRKEFKPLKKRFKNEKELVSRVKDFLTKLKGTDDLKNLEYVYSKKQEPDFFEEVLNSVLLVLDKHSVYFNPKIAKDFLDDGKSQKIGFGFQIMADSKNQNIAIMKVYPKSAISKTILEKGDEILEVNHKSIEKYGTRAVFDEISNQSNKNESTVFKVKTYIDKNTFPEVFDIVDITVSPEDFDEEKISSSIIEKDDHKYLYIKLDSFYENCSLDLKETYLNRKIEEPLINGLILDLRNNPGGFLNETLAMANYFIGDKIVLQVDDKNSKNIEKLYSSTHKSNYWFLSPPPIITEKVIVLTNARSASASEILSGILKSYNRAVIVGDEHTYGKGSIQNLISLISFELGLLKISTNVYFLADGTTPQFEGVKSDIVIPSESAFSDAYEKKQPFTLKPKHKFKNEVSYDFDTISKPVLQILKHQSKKRVEKNKGFLKYKNKKNLEEFYKNNPDSYKQESEDLVLTESLEILKDLLEIKDDY